MALLYGGLVLLVYAQFGAGRDYKKNRTICILIGAFLFIISAMKAIESFNDLQYYAASYERLPNYKYINLWNNWRDGKLKDGVFYICSKFLADIGIPAEVWMGIIALIFGLAVGWFIFRNSAKPVLSLTMLLALEYYLFTLSGLRQAVAMAIILLFSYDALLDRKLVRFVVSVLIASLFHSSAMLFLPAYLVVTWKLGWKQVVLVVTLLFIYFFFPNVITWAVNTFAWTDSMASYAKHGIGLSWSGVIIQSCVLFVCVLFRKDTTLEGYWRWRRVDAFVNLMIVGLCLLVFSTIIAEMFRIAYYYSIGCIAAVANVVEENKREENHSTMYILISLCLVAYMVWSKAFFNLKFFWQI